MAHKYYLSEGDKHVLQRRMNKIASAVVHNKKTQRRPRAISNRPNASTFQIIRGTATASTTETSQYVILGSILPFEENSTKPSTTTVKVAIPVPTIINSGDTIWAVYRKGILTALDASVIDWYQLPVGTGVSSPPLRWFEIKTVKNTFDDSAAIWWVGDDGLLLSESDIIYDPHHLFNGQPSGYTSTAIRGMRGIALQRTDISLTALQPPRWEMVACEGYSNWIFAEYMAPVSGSDERKVNPWYRFTGEYSSKHQWMREVPGDSGDPIRFKVSDLVDPQIGDIVLMNLEDPDALTVPAGGYTWQPKYIPVSIKERNREFLGTWYSGQGPDPILVNGVVPILGSPDPRVNRFDNNEVVSVYPWPGDTYQSGDVLSCFWIMETKSWRARQKVGDRKVAAGPDDPTPRTFIELMADVGVFDTSEESTDVAVTFQEITSTDTGAKQIKAWIPDLSDSGGGTIYQAGCGISLVANHIILNYATVAGNGIYVNPPDVEAGRPCPKFDIDVLAPGIVYQRAVPAAFRVGAGGGGSHLTPGTGLVKIYKPTTDVTQFDTFDSPVIFNNWSQVTPLEVGDQVLVGMTRDGIYFAIPLASGSDWRYFQTTPVNQGTSASFSNAGQNVQVGGLQVRYYKFVPNSAINTGGTYTLVLDPNDSTTPLTMWVEYGDIKPIDLSQFNYFGRASKNQSGQWSADWITCDKIPLT